jgi:hypothetical protein
MNATTIRMAPMPPFPFGGRLAGAELLGKHLGMFHGENQGVTVKLPFDGWRIERAIVYPDTQP